MVTGDEDDILSQLPHIECSARVKGLIDRVLRAAVEVSGASVRAFGSSVNGFGDDSSDVDLLLAASRADLIDGLRLGKVSTKDLAPRALAYLQPRLRKQGFHIDEKVLHARVPILKMSCNNISCDLSVNNLLPLFNSRLLKSYADIDYRAVEVTIACKRWARDKEVHGAPLGYLSSYAFTLMVIFFMQVRKVLPCLQKCAADKPKNYADGSKEYNVAMDEMPIGAWSPSNASISFEEFVRFYIEEFKWGTSVVSVRTGAFANIADYPRLGMKRRAGITDSEWAHMLHIEDPFDVERNLTCVLAPGSNEKLWYAFMNERKNMTSKDSRPKERSKTKLEGNEQPVSTSTGRMQELSKAKIGGAFSSASSKGVSLSTVNKVGGLKGGAGGKEYGVAHTFYPASRITSASEAVRPAQEEVDSEQMWVDAFTKLLQLGKHRNGGFNK